VLGGDTAITWIGGIILIIVGIFMVERRYGVKNENKIIMTKNKKKY
jgi:putative Mn2+ efflux pump MntP